MSRGGNNRTHGMCDTLEYMRWVTIKQRCFNPNDPSYPRYGGRGIVMCSEWAGSFAAFYAATGDAPEGMSLDRIDNERGYEPGNVRWATRSEQQHNRRPFRTMTQRSIDHLVALGYQVVPPLDS